MIITNIGIFVTMFGMMAMDSENLFYPIAIMAVGALLTWAGMKIGHFSGN